MSTKLLSEKIALITGSSNGIGAATAVEFAKEGASLVLHGRNEEDLKRTKAQCIEHGAEERKIAMVIADLAKDESIDVIVKATLDAFGTIDILFHNAGGGHTSDGPIHTRGSVEALDHYHKVMLKAPYLLTQRFLPKLIERKGAIVFNSSIYGKMQEPEWTSYCITKAGVDQMCKVFALSLAPTGVRVNAFRAGIVRTNACKGLMTEEDADMLYGAAAEISPLEKKLATPKDIARVAVFLASNQSSSMTGSLVDCDGGWSCTHTTLPSLE